MKALRNHSVKIFLYVTNLLSGFPRWCSGKETASRMHEMQEMQVLSWVGKIPWSSKWQPTPGFLPGKFHGEKSLLGYSSEGGKESDTTERLSTHTHYLLAKCICDSKNIILSNTSSYGFSICHIFTSFLGAGYWSPSHYKWLCSCSFVLSRFSHVRLCSPPGSSVHRILQATMWYIGMIYERQR